MGVRVCLYEVQSKRLASPSPHSKNLKNAGLFYPQAEDSSLEVSRCPRSLRLTRISGSEKTCCMMFPNIPGLGPFAGLTSSLHPPADHKPSQQLDQPHLKVQLV